MSEKYSESWLTGRFHDCQNTWLDTLSVGVRYFTALRRSIPVCIDPQHRLALRDRKSVQVLQSYSRKCGQNIRDRRILGHIFQNWDFHTAASRNQIVRASEPCYGASFKLRWARKLFLEFAQLIKKSARKYILHPRFRNFDPVTERISHRRSQERVSQVKRHLKQPR